MTSLTKNKKTSSMDEVFLLITTVSHKSEDSQE